MPTTINAQNALQIRERPMDVYISFQTGSTAKIQTYTPSGSYKSYDSTLGNTDYSMRNLADLAGNGFPLDGSCDWYDSTLSPSSDNGKLGLRGDAGQNLTLGISATAMLTTVTVATRGVDTITVGADTYPSTGLNVIPINAMSATLVFTPALANGRAEVDYIVPGIILNATNDDLVSCTLALRGNLSVKDHTWEESEIEVQMYYPYDISSSFAYVQNDWPITYQAGYDSDLSTARSFYLSEPIVQNENIITIKGVDASHLLEEKTIQERWEITKTAKARQWTYSDFIIAIESAGITLERIGASPSGSDSGTSRYFIVPEKTARQWVAEIMNLTLNHERGGNLLGIQFVDAGIPTVEFGDGTTYGSTWSINKSDCGDWSETFGQNISQIKDTNEVHNFNETVSISNASLAYILNHPLMTYEAQQNKELIDLSFDGYYYLTFLASYRAYIKYTPSGIVFKHDGGAGTFKICGYMANTTGGVASFSNPNGLPGITLEMDPEVYGALTDTVEPILNHGSLFKRSTHTAAFTWKGDPRMQPLDYIEIIDDTQPGSPSTWYRVTNIELTHEGGGTIASIEAREWTAPAGA